MNLFLTLKYLWAYTILVPLLVSSLACTYKPAYLDQGKKDQVSERWRVEKINPSYLSPDEKSTYETLGAPQYVRFYRNLSPDREKVYAWIYTDPLRLVTFLNGKKTDYVVLDADLSAWNEYQRKQLLWGGVTAGAVVGLGVLIYYLVGK